jgi:hypothetical protein
MFGIVPLIVIGVLNFHPPHFLIESSTTWAAPALLAALVAVVGISRNLR